MPIYHENKMVAMDSIPATIKEHWNVKCELEPFNGIVVVLSPKSLDVFKYPLHDLLDHYELDFGRVRHASRAKVRPPRTETNTKKASPPPPPPPPAGKSVPRPIAPPVAAVKRVAPPPPPPPLP